MGAQHSHSITKLPVVDKIAQLVKDADIQSQIDLKSSGDHDSHESQNPHDLKHGMQHVNDILKDTHESRTADSNTNVKCLTAACSSGEQRDGKEEPQWQICLGAHTFNGSGSIKRIIVGTNNIVVTGKMKNAGYKVCESSEKYSPPIKRIKYFHFDGNSNEAELDVHWDMDKIESDEKHTEIINDIQYEKNKIVCQYINQCSKPTQSIKSNESTMDSCATVFSSMKYVNDNNDCSRPLKMNNFISSVESFVTARSKNEYNTYNICENANSNLDISSSSNMSQSMLPNSENEYSGTSFSNSMLSSFREDLQNYDELEVKNPQEKRIDCSCCESGYSNKTISNNKKYELLQADTQMKSPKTADNHNLNDSTEKDEKCYSSWGGIANISEIMMYDELQVEVNDGDEFSYVETQINEQINGINYITSYENLSFNQENNDTMNNTIIVNSCLKTS